MSQGYIDEDLVTSDVWPCFLHFVSTTFDEDQSLHYFSKMMGEFLFQVTELKPDFLKEHLMPILRVYKQFCTSTD